MPRRVGALPRIMAILGVLAMLAMPTTAPAAAGEPGSAPFLQVRVDSVTPDLITTTSEPTVTVTGTVTNVGDRPVRDVVARLEHAGAVSSSAGLRTNLDGANDQFQPVGDFTTVAAEMQRGQAVGFTFSYPIRSRSAPSLEIDQPGVYPLLVNINGTPDYGDAARLDDARFLLPVLGVPPDAADPASDTVADVVPPDTAKPVAMTMLWPLADKPRLAPGVPGGTTPVRLMNDDLAVSLAAGGRLDTLLSAVDFATSPDVDPGGETARALCLAIDPDLLVTVNAMTGGYVVADAPDGLGTAAHPGTGQAAAAAWLDRLRALAKRMCVAPTPYAQADLGALQRVGDRRARLRGDQRRRRHHRPDPGHHVRPRRHDPGRRTADPARGRPARRPGADGGDRGGGMLRPGLRHRRTDDRRRRTATVVATGGDGAVRPGRRRRAGRGRAPTRPADLCGLVAERSAQPRLHGRPPPGRVSAPCCGERCSRGPSRATRSCCRR